MDSRQSDFKTMVAEYERALIEARAAGGLAGAGGAAAASLGILPTTLHEKMKRLGLRAPGPDPSRYEQPPRVTSPFLEGTGSRGPARRRAGAARPAADARHPLPLGAEPGAGACACLDGDDVGLVDPGHELQPRRHVGTRGHRAVPPACARATPSCPCSCSPPGRRWRPAVQMVKEGASDYLAKPWDDAEAPGAGAEPAGDARARHERARRASGAALREELARAARPARPRLRERGHAPAWSRWPVQVAAADVPVLDHRARTGSARRSWPRSSRPTRAGRTGRS